MSEESATTPRDPSRRAVLGTLAGIGVGVPLLSACGAGGAGGSGAGGSGAGGSGAGGSGGGGTTPSGPIAKKADVPVGSGKLLQAEKVVLTQPTQGQFKAFSAICTHQGCPLSAVTGKDIPCNCHGSRFSIEDGSVVNGPATEPLPELEVKVSGEDLSIG